MVRDQYQTVKEVADRLKVNEATVRGWIRHGELRAIDIGKGWRIADSDLAAFLKAHATGQRPEGRGATQDADPASRDRDGSN
ncbi:MAG: helix-turn-helix domain-containing protein [Hoeflea sp.]|uniref:helix-turn-helix domain-containing protein n=1 Tax=Hoeflea sp. TaxID=1940281 RepID=UPI001DE8D05B|nr:helix-turn-helix domain-containing protein [Hoeflea sp.]MBU4528470.1 helix-turn-helix domain-containing protein [Alphaproteobacteria bacterium]MBU4543139.1 helix-turn-helix domain-containing protein [Alphaproteobacteria bacterium]MBU4551830.1 helix-turn-helix domain-containing protein [Alphaproteobacteria bacterium]MBV1723725.1 helix-turn-helix domain-containing protein [Hoeflea sp.]MBV1762041.1 helix-turn-helix domain-containing protein [Hoeflea sp.]